MEQPLLIQKNLLLYKINYLPLTSPSNLDKIIPEIPILSWNSFEIFTNLNRNYQSHYLNLN
jgi:hypothetical protein